MDIKLKNSDMDHENENDNDTGSSGEEDMDYGKTGEERTNRPKSGWFAAVVIITLFAVIFQAFYPDFQRRVQAYKENHLQGSLQDSNFLTRLNVSNYIFYKEIVEKVEQSNYDYYDLYVDMDVIGQYDNMQRYSLPDSESYVSEDIELLMDQIRRELDYSLREDWQNTARNEVAQWMDYCVVDHTTGEFIKNTERNIEALASLGGGAANVASEGKSSAETGKERELAQETYEYYVILNYDSAGNLNQVAVKDENSDELLKKVQSMMKNSPLEQRMRNISSYYKTEGTFYGYSSADSSIKAVHYQLNSPHDVTFIYAMTGEQKQVMIGSEWFRGGGNEWYIYYYQCGIGETLSGMLICLTLAALILMNFKWYGLHRTNVCRIPLEISVLAVIVWLAAFPEWVLELVGTTCMGLFSDLYEKNLSFLPAGYYPAVTYCLNFVFLFLFFGGWFYVINSFGEVRALGIRGFLRERSVIVKILVRLWKSLQRYYERFKREMLHVDLGRNATQMVRKVVIVNFVLLAVICSMWVFGWMALLIYSIVLYFILKKYVDRIQKQYGKLLEATNSIAEGNLHTVFDEDLGVFESYKTELYRIQEGFRKAVDEEVKSQRMKTELITNVSHDLKTPLTAITTYIDLLKDENITEAQRKEYLAVLEKKSLRLKTLIEDLFEVSKANSRNVTVNLVEMDICNLMRQVYLEYEDRVEEANLIFRFRMPQEKVVLKLDSQKMYRIFENLYINIIKYAMTGTRVYVDLERGKDAVRIELKNISATELYVEPEELTERFVRGDSSRNTEGSGLGLAIAKSFAEVQGGKMEVIVDGDLFKVILWF